MRGWILAALLGTAASASAAPQWRVLEKGAHSAVTKSRYSVIQSPDSWQQTWKEHTANVEPKPALPQVDFSREQVVAIFMGQRPTGGYGIAVTGVTVGRKEIHVAVRESSPPAGAIVPQIVTSPYVFAAIPKRALPVKFDVSYEGGRR